MKKVQLAFTLLFVLSLLMMACNKNNEAMNEKAISVPIYNCTAVKTNAGIHICYDSLVSESRCPEDVVCVWEGYAKIKVTLVENGNTHRFPMIIMPGNQQHINQFGGISDTTINGYTIKLTGLLPYPRVLGPAPTPDQYKAVFTITH